MPKVSGSTTATGAKGPNTPPSRFAARKSLEPRSHSIFESVTPERLVNLIETVTREGDLISFSRTMDGGAVCVSVLSGTEAEKWYASSTDDLEANMGDIFRYYV